MERGSQEKKEMGNCATHPLRCGTIRGKTFCKISKNITQQAVPRPIILRYFVDIAVAKTVDNRKFTLGDKWPAYPELPDPTNYGSYFVGLLSFLGCFCRRS